MEIGELVGITRAVFMAEVVGAAELVADGVEECDAEAVGVADADGVADAVGVEECDAEAVGVGEGETTVFKSTFTLLVAPSPTIFLAATETR